MRCSTLRGTFCSLITLATPKQDWTGSNPSRREGGGCGFTLSRSHSCCAVRLVYTQISPGHIWTTLYKDAKRVVPDSGYRRNLVLSGCEFDLIHRHQHSIKYYKTCQFKQPLQTEFLKCRVRQTYPNQWAILNIIAHLRNESHALIESEELNLRVNSHNILAVSWNSKVHYHMPRQMNAVHILRLHFSTLHQNSVHTPYFQFYLSTPAHPP